MRKTTIVHRSIPSILVMASIYYLSSLPSSKLPDTGVFSGLVEAAGHALIYALLSLSYYLALPDKLPDKWRSLIAFIMAACYGLSDEWHQSMVEGRTSSLIDVLFDCVGAALALTLRASYSPNSSSNSAS